MKITATETEIQAAILEYLTARRILAWRCQAIPVPIRRGGAIVGLRAANKETVGIPDILCVLPGGKLFAIEVKKPGKDLRPEQTEWMIRLERAGADWMKATSTQDVQYYLRDVYGM